MDNRIQAVLNWAENKPRFDTSFLHSLEEAYDEYEELTEAQSDALDNIINRFRIDVEEWA